MSCEINGIVYHPTVNVIGFEGGKLNGNILGIPHESFNRYVADYNDRLYDTYSSSDVLKSNSKLFSTVHSIVDGKTDFIDDGLHYSDDTLRLICDYIDFN